MKEAAERFGGFGGGHNIAAGAQIPLGKEDEFLSFADSIISKTMVGVRL
jgi:RecJ-like exonuclease